MSKDTVDLKLTWKTFQPDCRPYKPSNPLIEVETLIVVKIPLKEELLANYVTIAGQQVSGETESHPQLTLLGMKYVIDQFESIMSPVEDKEKDTEDWDDTDNAKWDSNDEHPTAKDNKDDWDESETDEPSVEK